MKWTYRGLLYGIAENVACAAREGRFLGFVGQIQFVNETLGLAS
jgi:hypothetical protein